MIKLINPQEWDISRRFSVAQRKMGWQVRVHPKKFNRRLRSKWQLKVAYPRLQDIPTEELKQINERFEENLAEYITKIQQVKWELRRRESGDQL